MELLRREIERYEKLRGALRLPAHSSENRASLLEFSWVKDAVAPVVPNLDAGSSRF
jgi:hypothetical protein